MDVTFSLAERWTEAGEPAGICGEVEFRTDVFDAASIEALIERLRRVLVAMTADPGRRLSSVDVLDAGEHARLDEIGNRAVLTRSAPSAVSVPVLFAAQVARTPEAVALSGGERSRTYRELDEASNRLAHLLAGQGAGPGQSVALLFSRSAEAIVAILAVLKSGAAYLPIDPGLPSARIGFMVADAAPASAITTAGLADRLDGHDVAVVDVDDPAVAQRIPARHCLRRPPTISLTSSTPRAPPVSPRAWPSPTTTSPSCWHRSTPACLPAAGVVAVPLVRVRFLGVGDLRCAAVRGAAGGGARTGGRLTRRAACFAGHRTGQRVKPDPVGGGDALTGGVGVGGVGGGRGALPGRAGRPLGAWAGDDQRLRPDRGHGVRRDQCAADRGAGGGADRCAGAGRGVVRAGCLVAAGAGRAWWASCMWPAPESAWAICAGPG